MSVLRHCIAKFQTDLLDLLQTHGILFQQADFEVAFAKTCNSGNTEMAEYCLTKFPGIQRTMRLDNLIEAAKSRDFEAVKHSVCYSRVNMNERRNGKTAIETACTAGDVDMVKLLLKLGAKLYEPNNNFKSALLIAGEQDHVELVRFLVEYYAEIDPDFVHRTSAYNTGAPQLYFVLGYSLTSARWNAQKIMADGIILCEYDCQEEVVRGITQASFIYHHVSREQYTLVDDYEEDEDEDHYIGFEYVESLNSFLRSDLSKFKLSQPEVISVVYGLLEADHTKYTNRLALQAAISAAWRKDYDLFCDLIVRYVTDLNPAVFDIDKGEREAGDEYFPLIFYIYSAYLTYLPSSTKRKKAFDIGNRYFKFLLERGASVYMTNIEAYGKNQPVTRSLLNYIFMHPDMSSEVCDNFV